MIKKFASKAVTTALATLPTLNCAGSEYEYVDFSNPMKPKIKWAEFLSKNDLVWSDGVKDSWGESAFIANGLTGASIYGMSGDKWKMRWELGRTDVSAEYHLDQVDWNVPRIPIGNIILEPKGNVVDSNMRLQIWNAQAQGEIVTDKGKITWESFIERESNVVVIKTKLAGDEKGVVPRFVPEWGISPRIIDSKTPIEDIPAENLPVKPYFEKIDKFTVAIQPLTVKGANAVASYSMKGSNKKEKIFLLSVGKVYNPKLSQKKNVDLAIEQALDSIRKVLKEGVGETRRRHRAWWHDYLTQSFLTLPNDSQWEQFYWLQIYKFGAASRVDYPIMTDVLGPWFHQCGWPGTWWNLNVELSYFPTYSANRMDVGKTLVNTIDYFFNNGMLESRKNPEAICMTRSTAYNLMGFPGESYEMGNMTWVLHNYWKYWRYGMDEEIGENLFKLLKANIKYFIDNSTEDNDGVIHTAPMVSPEYSNDRYADTNYTLQLFQWALKTAIEMNKELGKNEPDAQKWKYALNHLAPLPVNENGLMISPEVGFDHSHRHYSHLLALYPLHTINPEQGAEAKALFKKSLERWQSLTGALLAYSYTGGCAMYATLKEGDKALETLNKMLGTKKGVPAGTRLHNKIGILWNTMYTEGGGPVIETPLSAVESIDYMLLQSWNGIVRVFPAVPRKWENVIFDKLRTEGAFLVSAQRNNGKTSWVKFKSLAGKELIFETDMEKFESVGSFKPEIIEFSGPQGQKRWKVRIPKNKTLLLKSI